MIPRRIIIHHSATEDGQTFSWATIRKFHVESRGWLDIGYHAGVELVGPTYECMYGRPASMHGAHTAGKNRDSLGFCFVGNFDLVAPEPERLAVAVRRVIAPWCVQYGLGPEDIFGHRDFSEKTCPGKLFDLDDLRYMVREAIGRRDA